MSKQNTMTPLTRLHRRAAAGIRAAVTELRDAIAKEARRHLVAHDRQAGRVRPRRRSRASHSRSPEHIAELASDEFAPGACAPIRPLLAISITYSGPRSIAIMTGDSLKSDWSHAGSIGTRDPVICNVVPASATAARFGTPNRSSRTDTCSFTAYSLTP